MLKTKSAPRLLDPNGLAIERIDDEPGYAALLEELRGLEQRLKGTEARRKRAKLRAAGGKPARSVVDRATDLVRGGEVPGFDVAAEINACHQEQFEILAPAIRELTIRLDGRRQDLSLAACERVQAQHYAALLAAFRAIEDLRSAFEVTAGIAARLTAAGYTVRHDLLPGIPPGLWLWVQSIFGTSPAWFFEQELKKRGII